MKENFERMLAWVKRDEGEYSDHPEDNGGPTRLGITLGTLKRWRKVDSLTAADVKALTEEEVHQIYKEWYWDVVRADDLPSGVDYFVFDSGLLSGPGTAVKWLQRAVGVSPDMVIGPKTLEAIAKDDPKEIILKMEKLRRSSLKSLSDWRHFGRGWTNRVNKSKIRALKLAKGE